MARSSGRNAETRKKGVTLTGVTLTVIAVLFLVALVVNSNLLRRSTTAAEVSGVKFSPVEYTYFYNSAISEYSSSATNLPDSSKPLASQINYETGQTWEEFFEERAMSSLRLIGSVYAEAQSKGFTLTAEQQQEMDEAMTDERAQIEMYYASAGGFKGYLRQLAPGMTEKVYNRLMEMRYVVMNYSEGVNDAFEYTDEQLKEYYAENRDELDTFSYRSVVVTPGEPEYPDSDSPEDIGNVTDNPDSTDEPTITDDTDEPAIADETGEADSVPGADEVIGDDFGDLGDITDAITDLEVPPEHTEEEIEAAEKAAYDKARYTANAYAASITDERSFIEAAREYDAELYAEDDSTLITIAGVNLEYLGLPTEAIEWLKSADTGVGAVKSVPISEDEETNTGFYVLYFAERSDNDYLSVNFRDLTITAKTVNQLEFTDAEGLPDDAAYNAALEEAKEAASEKASALYASFIEGGATEEKLAEITEDVFNEVTGDRYDNVPRKAGFDTAIDEWLYSDGRANGDHTLLQTADGNWHILFFAEYGKKYNDYLADTRLRGDDFTAWEEAFESREVKIHWAMKLRSTAR
ncbi:MAG: hypothetical protein LBH17_00310 [Oscillospiraceae bacterium]|jgi:hypothetical protein|nr:hypothetical protein [Oscillospiraceae bacterium]